ncbi:UNVERIFIED_CONTAM: long-chain fatty acid--CoA ligase [Kocuria sp. CPCC 205316]|uniref:long-chain-fatty-acid--CoA ligase n=1 Tax=Kocuria TaxID=57493 RepID=UPI0036DE1D44
MPNLASLLVDTAARHPRRPAVVLDDTVLGYAELDDLSARAGTLLRRAGVRPGDRVALVAPNVPHMPIAYYGILRAGSVVVPLNPLLTPRELAHHFQDAEVSAVVVWETMAGACREALERLGLEVPVVELSAASTLQQLAGVEPLPGLEQRAAQDMAVLLYTSGTTGRPKGAMLTHDNLLGNAEMVVDLFRIVPEDVFFGGLPFFHVFGQTVALNAVVAAGAAVTLLPRFAPRSVLEILRRDGVTVLAGVPSMHVALLEAAGDRPVSLPALRAAISGGAALPVEVLRRFEDVFAVRLYEGYGLSETSPVVSFNQLGGPVRPGSIGTAVPGARLRVLDDTGAEVPTGEVGELAVAGRYVMAGYWRSPEATAEVVRDGWFRTGDLARIDDDGCVFIVDRKKDMILRGGYNVYPREVEEALYEHPAVAEVAVVGIPDDVQGQEVAAFVVLTAEATPDGERLVPELRSWVRERVASYKRPRLYRVVDALPKGPTGKILKREVEHLA